MGNIIHASAIIYDGVVLGDNIYIGPGCIIGAPPEHPDIDPRNYQSNGMVVIKDGSILHGNNTVDCGMNEPTIIGENCILMKGAHVGHDVQLGQKVVLACGSLVGGHSKLSDYSYIGLNAVLHQFSVVGKGAMLGASGFSKGELEEFGMYVGVPAKKIGLNVRLMSKMGINHE